MSISLSRCTCRQCDDANLSSELEYHCCREIGGVSVRLVQEERQELCITRHRDFSHRVNRTVLEQVAPLLKDKNGRSYHKRRNQTKNGRSYHKRKKQTKNGRSYHKRRNQTKNGRSYHRRRNQTEDEEVKQVLTRPIVSRLTISCIPACRFPRAQLISG